MTTLAEYISELEARRARYILAERYLVETGQAYSIGNRSLTRADLKEIRAAISELTGQLNAANRGNSIMCHRVVPRDI